MIVGRVLEAKKTLRKRDKVVATIEITLTKEIRRIVTLIQEETIEEEGLSMGEGKMQEEVMDH